MPTPNLSKLAIGYSPLSSTIFIYRFGKDPGTALDKRPATMEAVWAVGQYLMQDAPKGASMVVNLEGRSVRLSAQPVPAYAELLKLLHDERWADRLAAIDIVGPAEVWIDTGEGNQPLVAAEAAFATRDWLDQLAVEVGATPGAAWKVENFDGLAIQAMSGPNVATGMACSIRRIDASPARQVAGPGSPS